MWAQAAGLGGQLRWAAEVESVSLPAVTSVVVAGMGGSGISGDFAAVLAGVPLTVHKGYGLPSWAAGSSSLVCVVSHSGNTEESLSAARQAKEAGLAVAVVTSGGELARMADANGWTAVMVPGGLAPRASLGYLLGGLMRLLAAAGAAPDPVADLNEAAGLADELHEPDGAGQALARDLAEGLDGRIVIVYGSSGITHAVAQRWKTQINENAKWPAWWSSLPELDHNEIEGWMALPQLTSAKVGIIALRDAGEDPAVARRFGFTEKLIGDATAWVGEVWTQGESQLARLISATVLGDLVSLELATRGGQDPGRVPKIEQLKKLLSQED
jgi:glucose/mannose-6-phosphate isomerase